MKYVSPQAKPHTKGETPRQLVTSISYENKTGRVVTVVGRNGIPSVISPTFNVAKTDTFCIYLKYEFDSNVSFNAVARNFPEGSDDLKLFETAMMASSNKHGNRLEVKWEIDGDELVEEGSLYFDLLDLVITLDKFNIPPHPRSTSNMFSNVSQIAANNIFSYSIVIVDHTGGVGEKFIKIGKDVFPIHQALEASCPDGIYIFVCYGKNRTSSRHYDIDATDCPVTLYHTEEDAMRLGDADATLERQLKQEQAKFKALELQVQSDVTYMKMDGGRAQTLADEQIRLHKHQAELERAQVESELRESQALNEQLRKEKELIIKESHDRNKYKREISSTDRKATVEWIKMIPVVCTVASALMTIWIKK